jgi:hypothetical protein
VDKFFEYLKANPSVGAAFFGFVGVMIATTSTFLGVLISQYWEHKRKREERQEKRLDDLKAMYVKWLGAAQAASVRRIALEHTTDPVARAKLKDDLRNDTVFIATEIELFEPDHDALEKVIAGVNMFFADLEAATKPTSTPASRLADRVKFADHLAEVSNWLRDERFAVGYEVKPIKAGPLKNPFPRL